jgi:cyanate permease
VALTVQVVGQALGPVLSGALRDWTGSYAASLATFAVLAFAGSAAALLAAPPSRVGAVRAP